MYTLSHYQGHNEPLDNELLESYEGEAKEIILADFMRPQHNKLPPISPSKT